MADKVLAVDDDRRVRSLLKKFLRREGFEVVLASNGKKAIKLAKKENPQVILLDIKMPGMDGIEVCKRLKAEGNTRFIPIIVITAYSDKKTEAVEAGADGFVSKPLDLPELAIRLKSILRLRYLSSEQQRVLGSLEGLQANLSKKRWE